MAGAGSASGGSKSGAKRVGGWVGERIGSWGSKWSAGVEAGADQEFGHAVGGAGQPIAEMQGEGADGGEREAAGFGADLVATGGETGDGRDGGRRVRIWQMHRQSLGQVLGQSHRQILR